MHLDLDANANIYILEIQLTHIEMYNESDSRIILNSEWRNLIAPTRRQTVIGAYNK